MYLHKYGAASDVQANDVFFAVHALTLTVVTIMQCILYDSGKQTVRGAWYTSSVTYPGASLLVRQAVAKCSSWGAG